MQGRWRISDIWGSGKKTLVLVSGVPRQSGGKPKSRRDAEQEFLL